MNDMNEIWKPIEGYEGLYEVSNLGKVRSLKHKGTGEARILKSMDGCADYSYVALSKNGKPSRLTIHRLVGKAFVDGWFEGAVINHIDHDRKNNVWTNLEWTTQKDNCSPLKSLCSNVVKLTKGNKSMRNRPVEAIRLDDGEVTYYVSLAEFSRKTGAGYLHAAKVLSDRPENRYYRTIKGYSLRYLDPDEISDIFGGTEK